jgi:hypothetical protein
MKLSSAGVAGAVYVAPVLTSAAGASTGRALKRTCPLNRKCNVGPGGDAKCKKHGGPNCSCLPYYPDPTKGRCRPTSSPCVSCSRDRCCDVLHRCETCGCDWGSACFCDFNGTGCQCCCFPQTCNQAQPCPDGLCPAGRVCVVTCCPEPLCFYPCAGAGAAGATSVRKGRPGTPFR